MVWRTAAVAVALAVGAAGCGLFRRQPAPIEAEPGATQRGIASWYGPGFHGRRTASGDVYDQHGFTAAHRTLPHGTRVRVTNLANHRAVTLRINDRGPFVDDRVIDVSYAAARGLDMIAAGVVPVEIEVIDAEAPPIVAVAAREPTDRGRRAPPAGSPAIAVAPTAPAPRRYSVQVATFADYERARHAQRSLRADLGPAHLARIDVAGRRYYQVRVGPFARHPDAAAAARRIAALGFRALVVSP